VLTGPAPDRHPGVATSQPAKPDRGAHREGKTD